MNFTSESKVLVLEIPDELCLETDFYNFSDEIFAYQYPDELESYWDSIYDDFSVYRSKVDYTRNIKRIILYGGFENE